MSDGKEVDCSQSVTGQLVPQIIDDIELMTSSAKIVLLIEKDATFQKLMQDPAVTSKAILITAKGMPDLNTRQVC